MKKIKKNGFFLLFFICVIALTFISLDIVIPTAKPIKPTKVSQPEKRIEIIRMSAIGDSLTEGIGDTTSSGGYVPLLQRDLSDEYPVDVFQAENYGKSGDRSDQVLKRLKKNEDMRESVKNANIILLTVGGNDLMQALQPKIFGKVTLDKMEKPKKTYDERLGKLYSEIRGLNPSAPIYQLGIYNPFYLTFSNITELQEIVDFWNDSSKAFVDAQENAYFVPINDVIYQGLDHGDQESEYFDNLSKESTLNDLISLEDTFHPNNLGYQVIANAFEIKLASTKDKWLK